MLTRPLPALRRAAPALAEALPGQRRHASSLGVPFLRHVGEYVYPWYCYSGFRERLQAVFNVIVRRPLQKVQLSKRLGDFDTYDLVTHYKSFREAFAEGNVATVTELASPRAGRRVPQHVERRGLLRWEARVLKAKVVSMSTLQMSENEAIWNIALRVDTLQRTLRVNEPFEAHDLPLIHDPEPYSVPLPRRKRPDPLKPDPIAPWLRPQPYLLTQREDCAQIHREVEAWTRDWKREQFKQLEAARRGPPLLEKGDGTAAAPSAAVPSTDNQAAKPEGELPGFQPVTEYALFEIYTSTGQTKAEWCLLGFLDAEGRYREAVRELSRPPPAAAPLPPIRLFPAKDHPGQQRVPLGSTDRPDGRGWFYG